MELQPVGVCGLGSAGLMMGFDHLKNLFQPNGSLILQLIIYNKGYAKGSVPSFPGFRSEFINIIIELIFY